MYINAYIYSLLDCIQCPLRECELVYIYIYIYINTYPSEHIYTYMYKFIDIYCYVSSRAGRYSRYVVILCLLVVFWLFRFYGISTFLSHLTPNSVYIYTHIQPKISKRILRLVKFSISRISFVCTRLTSFKLSFFYICLSQEGQNVIYFDVLEQIG